MTDPQALNIVIVGGVAGGASAAARARRMNEQANIIMFEKDEHVSFANCGLPYHIGGEIENRDDLLLVKPKLFRDRFNIDVRTRQQVTAIDRGRKTVTVYDRDGDRKYTQAYDKLILAPGANPISPPIDGADADNVFTLRNVADVDRIVACLADTTPNKAVVIGAGYIGLEMVEQLRRLDIDVELVELLPQVLPLLDPEMAHMLEAEIKSNDVAVHLGDGVASIETEAGRAVAVTLESSKRLDADMVIMSIGVKPNTQLADDAGLALGDGGGIRVNEYLQTSDPDIYAVGDAVEYPYGPTGKPMRVPLAGPANRAGRLAGEHAATGKSDTMPDVWGTSIVRVFGKTVAMTGLSSKSAERFDIESTSVTIAGPSHVRYYPGFEMMWIKLLFAPSDGKVLGAQIVGGEGVDKRIDIIATAMHFGAKVRDLTRVDLAYAPPFGAAKDPVHMAAFAAQNVVDGVMTIHQPGEPIDDMQFVDVRTDQEVKQTPVERAIHIPLDELRQRMDELDREKPTIVTCASGQRSYVAMRMLAQNGFANVANMTGGAGMYKHAQAARQAASATT